MLKQSRSHFALLSCLFFVMIFGWKITPILDLSVLICLPVYLYAFCKWRNLPRLISASIWISTTLICLVFYEAFQFIHNDPSSPQWILRTIRSAISFGAVFIVINETREAGGHRYLKRVLLSLAIAISAHAIIVVISQLSDSFRAGMYAMTSAADYVNEMTMISDNRPLGLTYSLSLTSFVYFVAIAIFFTYKWNSVLQKILKSGLIAINFTACLWTARAGMIFFPLLAILAYKKNTKTSARELAVFSCVTLACLIIAVILLRYGPISIEHQFRRLGEIFVFITSPSHSIFGQQFMTMWHLPTGLSQLLFGNSLTGREEGYYVASDVGYILTLYGIGLVGQALMLLPILIAGFASFKLLKTKPDYGILALVILGSYLVLNVKELALMTRTVWPVICVFISISILEYQAERKRLNANKISQPAS